MGVTKASNEAWIDDVNDTPFTNNAWFNAIPKKAHKTKRGISFFKIPPFPGFAKNNNQNNTAEPTTRQTFNEAAESFEGTSDFIVI